MALLVPNVATFPESLGVLETVRALSLTRCVTLGSILSSSFYVCRKTGEKIQNQDPCPWNPVGGGMWAHLHCSCLSFLNPPCTEHLQPYLANSSHGVPVWTPWQSQAARLLFWAASRGTLEFSLKPVLPPHPLWKGETMTASDGSSRPSLPRSTAASSTL